LKKKDSKSENISRTDDWRTKWDYPDPKYYAALVLSTAIAGMTEVLSKTRLLKN
jgi:hypothetical protein